MVLIGGVTRLTGSGLSMVEWKPLMGAIPPLTHEDWLEVFGKYQVSPQYQLVNKGMSLESFQWIFFWEYFHRLIGRLIGVVFLIPWLFFWIKSYFDKKWALRFLGGFLLGGLQGLMGWIMVASGLVDKPQVSHYRLAAHLLLALFILGYFWNMAWQYYNESKLKNASKIEIESKVETYKSSLAALRLVLNFVLVLLIVQIFYGALVAGLHAGFMYNTFPDMEGRFFPLGAWLFNPAWKNIFENPLMVQWIHRTLAWFIFLGVFIIFFKFKNNIPKPIKNILIGLVSIVSIQFFLGVFTLVTKVNLPVAVINQVGASAVLMVLLWLRWEVHRIIN
jgi:cytochrome c oxidase assembly protein subunit 15